MLPIPEPTMEDLNRFAAEHIGATLDEDPESTGKLAGIGITNGAWRNTHLESLHGGDHPSGGISDADMLRFNIATSRLVSQFVTSDRIDWAPLRDALTDAGRVLPGGLTVGELAGDEFEELADDIDRALGGAHATEQQHGLAYALTRLALHGAMVCKHWYGTPWWEDVVDAFLELLDDTTSVAWRYDDGSKPEPASVTNRDALRGLLEAEPEALDDDGIYWCLGHGLGHHAAHRGYARWRSRRDPAWKDPSPWLGGE